MKKKQKSTPHNTVRIFSESAGHLPLNRNKYRKKLTAACAFAIVAALFSAANVGYIWIRNGIATSNARPAYLEPDPDVDNSSDDYYSTSVPRAEAAMEAGDYTNAKRYWTPKERNENTFAGALTYSELYNKTGDYDNAALVILNFLDKHYPPVNIHSQSPLYTDLQDIKGNCLRMYRNDTIHA